MSTQLAFPETGTLPVTHCLRCRHRLTDERSKVRGYGPVCWRIMQAIPETEPSTAPERELPAEIEAAISEVEGEWQAYGHLGNDGSSLAKAQAVTQVLRTAILSALEPERALRERAERSERYVAVLERALVIAAAEGMGEEKSPLTAAFVRSWVNKAHDELSADDLLTATSSAHDRGEG